MQNQPLPAIEESQAVNKETKSREELVETA
jgi:hypothetical protein